MTCVKIVNTRYRTQGRETHRITDAFRSLQRVFSGRQEIGPLDHGNLKATNVLSDKLDNMTVLHTPAAIASSLAVCFNPNCRMTPADGPTQTSPACSTSSANSAFSERKPEEGTFECKSQKATERIHHNRERRRWRLPCLQSPKLGRHQCTLPDLCRAGDTLHPLP